MPKANIYVTNCPKKTIELDSSNESNVNNISNKNKRLQSNKTPKVFFFV